MNLDNST